MPSGFGNVLATGLIFFTDSKGNILFKTYIASGMLALALFSYAQYHGWSVWGINESKPGPGTTRSAYHK